MRYHHAVPQPLVSVDGMEPRRRRTEYSEATRQALIDAARELFTKNGFAGTSTDQIVQRARVSRGALYHHFADKKELFKAVLEEVNRGLTEAIAARGLNSQDVWAGVVDGVNAFLDGCLDPSYQRIVLLDGPAVLGWAEWRTVGENHGLGLVRTMLQAAMDQGIVRSQPLEPMASMIHASLNEAGMHIATADDVVAAREQVAESVFGLIDGLRTS